jgi:hypothetical protein
MRDIQNPDIAITGAANRRRTHPSPGTVSGSDR